MEQLKRYVLLEDCTIWENDNFHVCDVNRLARPSGVIIGTIIKTSDDILELVEIGDLVEDTYGITAMVVAFGLIGEGGEDERTFKCCYVDVLYEDVKAIYKRQSNGDYKKYEAKQ